MRLVLPGRPAFLLSTLVATGCLPRVQVDREEEGHRALRSGGGAGDIVLATWNIEWFGSRSEGPSDEQRQMDNVVRTLEGIDADLVAVQEIVSPAVFDALLERLGDGHDGLLAGDGWVAGNRSYRTGEQQVGFIWRTERLELLDAEVVLRNEDWAFAGRPPLLARFEVDGVGGDERLALTLHAKASAALQSWQRRQAGSDALQGLLEGRLAEESVAVLGDFNDDIDWSIRSGMPSPYANLSDAYRFATLDLSLAGVSTMDRGRHTIDHILLTGAWDADGDADASVVSPDVERFSRTTSDHYPVRVAVHGGERGEPEPDAFSAVILNEVLANEAGTDPDGEFVELVHIGDMVLDLGGWTLSDEDRTRHVFEAGVLLAPGDRVVIWGGDASEGGLGLGNSGDAVRLSRPDGTRADEVRYGRGLAEADGVSMVRAVDGDPQALWVSHDTVASGPSSPGWGAGYAE